MPPIAPTVASMSAGAAVSVPKSESSTAIGAASTSSAVLTTWTLSTGTTSLITTSSVVGSTTGRSSGSEASKSSKASRVSGAPDTITRAFSSGGGWLTMSAIERSTMTWTRRLTAHAGAFFSSPPSRAAADWAGATVNVESSGAASVAMESTRCRSSQFRWERSAPVPAPIFHHSGWCGGCKRGGDGLLGGFGWFGWRGDASTATIDRFPAPFSSRLQGGYRDRCRGVSNPPLAAGESVWVTF